MRANERFDTKPTERDFQCYQRLWALLKVQGRNTFTADDFRASGMHDFFDDTQHSVGAMFARWKIAKLIEPTGRTVRSAVASNHGHKNPEYRMRGLKVEGPLFVNVMSGSREQGEGVRVSIVEAHKP